LKVYLQGVLFTRIISISITHHGHGDEEEDSQKNNSKSSKNHQKIPKLPRWPDRGYVQKIFGEAEHCRGVGLHPVEELAQLNSTMQKEEESKVGDEKKNSC